MLRDYVQDMLPSGEWRGNYKYSFHVEMTRQSTCMSRETCRRLKLLEPSHVFEPLFLIVVIMDNETGLG